MKVPFIFGWKKTAPKKKPTSVRMRAAQPGSKSTMHVGLPIPSKNFVKRKMREESWDLGDGVRRVLYSVYKGDILVRYSVKDYI